MAGLLYFKFGTQKSGIDHHFAPCIVPAWDWAHQHLAPEAAIMATMAVIMVGVTTRAIASDSFRWGSLTFSVRLPAFLSYLSRCDHRCRKKSNKWSEPFSCVQLSVFTSVSVSPNVWRLMTKIARHRVGVALMFSGVPYGWHRLLHTRCNLFLVGCHLFIFWFCLCIHRSVGFG